MIRDESEVEYLEHKFLYYCEEFEIYSNFIGKIHYYMFGVYNIKNNLFLSHLINKNNV